MYINSAQYQKLMRLVCAVCGDEEYLDFSIIREEVYNPKDDELIEIIPGKKYNRSFFDRLKMVLLEKKFYKNSNDNDLFIEIDASFPQIEDMFDMFFDVFTDYDLIELDEDFDKHIEILKKSTFKKFKLFEDHHRYMLFESSHGLKITMDESPHLASAPIHFGWSTRDPAILPQKDRFKIFKRYIFNKNWEYPFDSAYFYLSKEESISLLAVLSFIIENKDTMSFIKGEII